MSAGHVARLVRRPAPVRDAARELADTFPIDLPARARRALAADAVALASVVLPAALARHAERRPDRLAAAADVVRKFAREADLGSPRIGVRAQLRSPRLDARLGGLLGDDAARVASFLAGRIGPLAPGRSARALALEPVLARGVAAVAPLVLGAIADVAPSPDPLETVLDAFPAALLDAPAFGIDAPGAPRDAFRRVRRSARASLVARAAFWRR